MQLTTAILVAGGMITAALLVLAYLEWRRLRYDRNRHEEAEMERFARAANKRAGRLQRQQLNLGGRLRNLMEAATEQNPDAGATHIGTGKWLIAVEENDPVEGYTILVGISEPSGPTELAPNKRGYGVVRISLDLFCPEGRQIRVRYFAQGKNPESYSADSFQFVADRLAEYIRDFRL